MRSFKKDLFKRLCAGTAALALMLCTCGDIPADRGLDVFAEAAGAFTVTGGALDTDYTYADGVMTIKSGTPLTISGTTTSDRIEVANGVSADITLSGVTIDVSGTSGAAAFKIADESKGNVTLTLVGGNTLKSGENCAGLQKNGYNNPGVLTIGGTGSLYAKGGTNASGIGGGSDGTGSYNSGKNGDNIIISSGNITAEGGDNGAGIGGGGKSGGSENIVINGGTVNATGGKYSAGIGGGSSGYAFDIVINGGTVTATGGKSGSGIGGGTNGSGEVIINGGSVTATGTTGIGGAGGSLGSKITINGGTVNATGTDGGAGIGEGPSYSSNINSKITITGGVITARADGFYCGAGIGTGNDTGSNNSCSITISGGTVTASSEKKAAIGDGSSKAACSFSTGDSGNAFIIADSISGKTEPLGGVFFEGGGDGQIYGNPVLNADAVIPEGKSLTVQSGTTLTVGEGVTLTNNGTIVVEDGGILTGEGTLAGSGTLTLKGKITADMIYVPSDLTYTGEDLSDTILNGSELAVCGKELTVSGWTKSVENVSDLLYRVKFTNGTDTLSKDVNINKFATEMTAERDKLEYEYSDNIVITATVTLPKNAAAGQVTVYENGTQIGTAATPDGTGKCTLTLSARERGVGEHTFTVKYAETDVAEAAEQTLTVSVKPCSHKKINSENKCEYCGETVIYAFSVTTDKTEYEYSGSVNVSAEVTAGQIGNVTDLYLYSDKYEDYRMHTGIGDGSGKGSFSMQVKNLYESENGKGGTLKLTVKFYAGSDCVGEDYVTVTINDCKHDNLSTQCFCNTCGTNLAAATYQSSGEAYPKYFTSAEEALEYAKGKTGTLSLVKSAETSPEGDCLFEVTADTDLTVDIPAEYELSCGKTVFAVNGGTLRIKNGKISSTDGAAVTVSSGEAYISGGNISSLEYVPSEGSKVSLSGGEFGGGNVNALSVSGGMSIADMLAEGYGCFASGALQDASKNSFAGYVTIMPMPVYFTVQPVGGTLTEGYKSEESITLTVETGVNDTANTVSCDWYVDGKKMVGETGKSLTVPAGLALGDHEVYCTATCGNFSVNSEKAVITVTACPHEAFDENGICVRCRTQAEAKVTIDGNDTFYISVIDAFKAVKGKTAEMTLMKEVTVGESTVLEVPYDTKLTLKMADGAKLIKNGAMNDEAFIKVNQGTLNLEGCNIEAKDKHSNSRGVHVNMGILNIRDSRVTADGFAVYANSMTTVNIYSGEFTGGKGGFRTLSPDIHLHGGAFSSTRDDGKAISIDTGRTTVNDFLANDCAYRTKSGNWLAGDELKALEITENVEVRPVPINIIEQPEDTEFVYGREVESVVSVRAQAVGVYEPIDYQWYTVENGVSTAIENYSNLHFYSLLLNSVGESKQVYCELTCDGYTMRTDTVTVSYVPAPLTISDAWLEEKTYDGNTDAEVIGVAFDGIVDEYDKPQYTATAEFTDVNAGMDKTAKVTVTLDESVKNYVLNENTFELTGQEIKKAEVILTAYDQTVTYGETSAPAEVQPAAAEVIYFYISDGEKVEGLPQNVGTYTVNATVPETENYKPTSMQFTLTVEPKTVSDPVIVLSESSFEYDGTAKTPSVTLMDGEMVIPSEEYTVSYSNNITVGTANVTVTDKDGGNYVVSGSAAFEITKVSQAALNITGQPENVVYGDSFTLGTSGGSGGGAVTWTVTAGNVSVDGSGKVTVKGTGKITIIATKAEDVNYREASAAYSFTADPKPIEITGAEIEEKVYDGTADATVTGVTFDGILPGDSAPVLTNDFTAAAEFDSAKSGTGRTVTVTVTPITGTARLRGSVWDLYALKNDTFILTGQTIEKADDPPTVPDSPMIAANTCETLGSLELPEGWHWDNAETPLEYGKTVTVTASYINPDKDNYKNISAEIAVTRSDCSHAEKRLDGAVKATCTEKGYTGDTVCTSCGAVIGKGTEIEKLPHSYSSKVTTEPTADSEGVRTYTCSQCGDTYTESIPKLPEQHEHSYTGSVTKAATCTENGVMTYTCLCGNSYTDTVPATGHEYMSKETAAADCTAKGVMTYSCTRCGASYTEDVPALGHDYTVAEDRAATCTEAGVTVYMCARCNDSCGKTTPAVGHDYKVTATAEPTTENAGYKTYTCARCGDSYNETIPKLPTEEHTHSYTVIDTKAAACTEAGYTEYTCECGGSYSEVIPALGHSYTEEETASATCTEKGIMTYSCTRCNNIYTEDIPAFGHSYTVTDDKAATCTEAGAKGYTCNRCNDSYTEKTPATGHDYQLTDTVEPTAESEGIETYTCSRCHDSYEKKIPKLPSGEHVHSYITEKTIPESCTQKGVMTYTCVQCGYSYTEDIPAAGHDYRTASVIEPTESSDGLKVYICTRCGDSYSETIPGTEHSHTFDKIWHSDGTRHWHECQCGEKSDISAHTEDSGTVTVLPAETAAGTRTFKCTVCGYIMRTEAIPPMGYRPDSTPVPTPAPSPAPVVTTEAKNENVPCIEGDNGKSGWEAISEEIVRTGDKGKVIVDMNGTTELPKNITEEIAGKDIDLVLDMGGGISWTINGLSVTNPASADMRVEKNTKNIPVDVINNISGESFTMQISLAHDGKFGFTAVLSIGLGRKNNGLYANLFYYNTDKGELEFADCSVIENGRATIGFTHASDYAIVIDSKPLGIDEDVSMAAGALANNEGLTENKTVYPVCGAAVIIAVGISAAMFLKRREK